MEEQLAQDQLLAAHRPVLQVAQAHPARLTCQAALGQVAQTLHHRLAVRLLTLLEVLTLEMG